MFPYLKSAQRKAKIMGFSSSIKSKTHGRHSPDLAEKLFEKFGHDKYYDIAVEMERVIESKLSQKAFIRMLTFIPV